MKINPFAAVAALVLIGAGGFLTGRISSPAGSQGGSGEILMETKSSRSGLAKTSGGTSGASKKGSDRGSRSGREGMESAQARLEKLEGIVRGENPLERNRALLAYIDQLGPDDFADAVGKFRELGLTDSRMGEYSLLLTAWAEADPASAMGFAKGLRNGFARDTILTTWATTDPEAAIRWAQGNHEGEGANPFLPGIIRGLVAADPTRATQLLAGMPRSEERGEALEFMLPHMLQQGNEATRAWVDGLADPTLRDGAINRVAERLAHHDPAGTVSWLLANPGEATQRRLDDVYQVWAAADSQAALSSFSTLPAGENRSNALRGVIGSVASEDPKAAIGLMDRYPEDVTDRLVQNFVWGAFGNDPATAAGQISRITDPRQQEQLYRRALDAWYERDPSSAVAWANANAIPVSVREHLNRLQVTQ